jgi:GT2 family glycosyltransferase
VSASPDTSIIVPLYRRIDFLRHQLAHFVHDPEIQDAELVYVLDSPELTDALGDLADELFALYRVPFRVVTLNRNGGFALANNLGASVARGRRLLLLNSDVIPAAPGWLGRLSSFYDATPRIGALGPKLLYEDESLQHAGLYFHHQRGVWYNHHYFKGLTRTLAQANVARPVPAVTAACLLVDHDLYDRVEGLSGVYVQGDYEDSDFCLRLLDAGRENWYLPDVELYHLEGQSYPDPLRRLNADYNRWLHTHLWHEQIEAAMERFGAPASV